MAVGDAGAQIARHPTIENQPYRGRAGVVFAGLRAVVEGAGSFAGTVFNCGMTEGTVAATAGDRFTAAGSAGVRSARNWASVSNNPGHDQLALMA